MSDRDFFHENHVAMSMEFKAWTDTHRVRLELDLDLDLGDQEEIECEEQDLEDALINTLESIKVASICLFKELELNFMIAARCALGHSHEASWEDCKCTQFGAAKCNNGTSLQKYLELKKPG